MRAEESDFSGLKTVSTFDKGDSSTLALDNGPNELHRFSPPSLFVESLLEQLCKLIEKDPQSQRRLYLTLCQKLHQMNLVDESYKLEEFQFMRNHYQKALYHFLTVAKSTSLETKAIYPTTCPKLNLTAEDISEWSRYSTEFHELQFLARGGFGHVYKARHKLDGENYAIKKIFLRFHNVAGFLQNLREVKMLAKLNHPNIVAYKAAWLEPLRPNTDKISIKEENTVPESTANGDSLEIIFESSKKSADPFHSHTSKSATSSRITSDEISKSSSKVHSKKGVLCEYKKQTYHFKYSQSHLGMNQCAILYIQMQLCNSTLRQWIDDRNRSLQPIFLPQCTDVFKQIVKGIEYIHSQGIIHHDLKPSNVFVSEDFRQVQIGDFGLACGLLAHPNAPLSVLQMSHQLGCFGTKLYAAPEQLRNICHPKSDVFSLGIILLELVQPFQTAMERSKVISQLKLGLIPTEITTSWPHLAKIISQTVTHNLKKRPTSSELLSYVEESESQSAAQTIENQDIIISQLREENTALKKQNEAKDEEIALLKLQIEKLIIDCNLKS